MIFVAGLIVALNKQVILPIAHIADVGNGLFLRNGIGQAAAAGTRVLFQWESPLIFFLFADSDRNAEGNQKNSQRKEGGSA